MGSQVNIIMLIRSSTILSPLLVITAASEPPTWSSLGLLSSQASKRSVEDNHESFLAEDMESSASDDLPDTDSYERDSSYNPPSSSYEAPGYSNSYESPSYESPSYSPSYEAYGGISRPANTYRGFGYHPSANSIS